MKKSKFKEEQIVGILQETDRDLIATVAKRYGVSDQLDIGRLEVMQDAQTLLDRQLDQLGRTVLRSGGSVKASDAKRLAETQDEKFDRQRKLERHREADERIAALAKEAKNLPKPPRR